jgi:predicted HicB family RNase H-like nuclease
MFLSTILVLWYTNNVTQQENNMETLNITEPTFISPATKKSLGVKPKPTKFGTVHFRIHEEIHARLKNEAEHRDISIPAMMELILVERYERLTKELG